MNARNGIEAAREGWRLSPPSDPRVAIHVATRNPTGFPGSCYPGQSNETAGTLCPGFFLGGAYKFQPGMTNFVIW